jgi:phospholipid/cholesterol/gamma-HCH transport system substrate-binding protein
MRKKVLLVVIAITVASCWRAEIWNHRFTLKTYFQDVQGLQAGASVRLAGVGIGKVTSVRALPERNTEPAEVVMHISTPYEINIPNDSTVSIETAGVLGEPFVEIEIAGAHGPPLSSGAILKSQSLTPNGTKTLAEQLGNTLRPCQPGADGAANVKKQEPKVSKPAQ